MNYRKPFVAIVALLGLSSLLSGQGAAPKNEALAEAPKAVLGITEKDLKAHLMTLAGDGYEGRLTGTPGQESATEYIAEAFARSGLKPLGDKNADGSRGWFHTYDITTVSLDTKDGLFLQDRAVCKRPCWLLPSTYLSGERNLELEGKLQLLKLGRGRRFNFNIKKNHIPVVVVDQDTSEDDAMDINRAMIMGMNQVMGRLRAVAEGASRAKSPCIIVLTREFNKGFQVISQSFCIMDKRPAVMLGRDAKGGFEIRMLAPRVPVMLAGGDDCLAILEQLGLNEEQAFAKETPEAASAKQFRMVVKPDRISKRARNVCGAIPGSDPVLSREAIVYSAHNDHVGLAPGGGIFNGADDNGSGTAALLELAEAYGQLSADETPKRSVIFLSVSGEELGLWGSEKWAKNPTWELEKVAANINIDMIGRSTRKVPSDSIAVTPTYSHRKYNTIAQEASHLGQSFNLSMANGDKFYARSDHYNFAKRGIPVVFFSDDEHLDYHMPSDTPDKIEYDKVQRVTQLAFILGHRVANREKPPETLGKMEAWGTPTFLK